MHMGIGVIELNPLKELKLWGICMKWNFHQDPMG